MQRLRLEISVGRNLSLKRHALQSLSDKMMDFWTNFCKYADPQGGWKPYTAEDPYMQILDIE